MKRQDGFISFGFLTGLVLVLPLIVLLGSYVIVQNNRQYFIEKPELVAATLETTPRTAIVFGSGLYPSGTPRPVLGARLDATVELYQAGAIDKVVVSGYKERFYDEPHAMREHLQQQGIPSKAIIVDNKGANTYASCDRARSSLGVEEAVLVTQSTHLPRAIYLCRSVGVTAYGYVADPASSRMTQAFQWFRETGSNVRAVFDVLTSGRTRYN